MVEFVDANVFLRYLTNDIPDKAQSVERLLRRAGQGKVRLVTTPMVVAEIVWTLESYYKLSKSQIKVAVLAILGTAGLQVSDGDVVLQAVVWYEEKNVDFIDAYHAARLPRAGISRIRTFDRHHFERFRHLEEKAPN